MKNITLLARPKQWSKNLFLFLPVFFAGELFDSVKFINVSCGFLIFSVVSSGIYILNDIKDIESDRRHPKKKYRPIASGKVSIKSAIYLLVFLLLSGFGRLPLVLFRPVLF